MKIRFNESRFFQYKDGYHEAKKTDLSNLVNDSFHEIWGRFFQYEAR